MKLSSLVLLGSLALGIGEFAVAAPAPSSSLSSLKTIQRKLTGLKCKEESSRLAQKGILELLPKILQGADIDYSAPDMKGKTCLHYACELGSRQLIHWLVENGADVNRAEEAGGNTPLHYSAKLASLYTVNYLLLSGAKANVRNNAGLQPVDVVGQDDHDAIVSLLQQDSFDERTGGAEMQAPKNISYDYADEIRKFTQLMPTELGQAVSVQNAQLRHILTPSDYLQIIKGELSWYDNLVRCRKSNIHSDYHYKELQQWSLSNLLKKLIKIARNPNNEAEFPREHFSDEVPEGIHYRGSLAYPKGALVYQDEEFVVELPRGMSYRDGHIPPLDRWLFWDARTCRLIADFYAGSINGGRISRLNSGRATFYIPFQGADNMGRDWAYREGKCYWLDVDARKMYSLGWEDSPLTKTERRYMRAQGLPFPLDEISHELSLGKKLLHPKSSASIELLGHSELETPAIDEGIPQIHHADCPRCQIWSSASSTAPLAMTTDDSNITYADLRHNKRETFLNFDNLTISDNEAGERDNYKLHQIPGKAMSPQEKFARERLDAAFHGWINEENALMWVKELGEGYTYFLLDNEDVAEMSGLVFPDGKIGVFQRREADVLDIDFSRTLPAEQCMLKGTTVIKQGVKPAVAAELQAHYIMKRQDDNEVNLLLCFKIKGDDVYTYLLRSDGKSHEISEMRRWHSPGGLHLAPIWLDEREWLLLPVNDNTYDIIKVSAEEPDQKLGQLILECSKGFAVVLPNGHYAGSPGCEEFLSMGYRGHEYDMALLAPWLNRPHEVLEALGGDEDDIVALREAHHRWLNKLGYRWDNMPVIPDLSELPKAEVKLPPLHTTERIVHPEVTLAAKSTAITRLHVLVDGTEVSVPRGINVQPGETEKLTVDIPLAAGQNWIEITPYDEKGQAGETVKFRTILRGREDSTLYVVAMGVSEYTDASLKLKYAAKDAGDLAETFRKYGVGEKKILCLRDKEVSDIGVLDKVAEFLSSATINDRLVFYVAGHGLLDNELNYFYAPADVAPDRLKETGISMEALMHTIRGCNARKRLLLLDTCHSGIFGEAAADKLAALDMALPRDVRAIPSLRGMRVESALTTLNAKQKRRYIEEMFAMPQPERGVNIVAASSRAEYALESDEWSHGIFTASLIDALRGNMAADNNGDGHISGHELQQYVVENVQKMTNGVQKPIMSGVEDICSMALCETILNATRASSGNSLNEWKRVLELLNYGCSARDYGAAKGFSIIRMAMERHAPLEVIDALLSAGASPNEALEWIYAVPRSEGNFLTSCRNKGYSPTEFLKIILKYEVNPRLLERIFNCNDDISFARFMLDNGLRADLPELLMETQDVKKCKLLVEKGANVNAVTDWGGTPLHEVQSFNKAEWLVQQGASVNIQDHFGNTPLHNIVGSSYRINNEKTRENICRLLLSKNADPTVQNQNGDTALHMACSMDEANEALIELLLERMENVNVQNKKGETPLHCLVRALSITKGHVSVCWLLLSKNADPTVQDKEGNTALHIASSKGKSEPVKTLVKMLLKRTNNGNSQKKEEASNDSSANSEKMRKGVKPSI